MLGGAGDASSAGAVLSHLLGPGGWGWAASGAIVASAATAWILRRRLVQGIRALAGASDPALPGGPAAKLPSQRGRGARPAWPLGASHAASGLRGTADREVLEAILANMSQGLCMFDHRYRLVVSNARFREIYGLSERAVQPGMHISDLLDACLAAGNHSESRRAEIEGTLARQLRSLERLSYLDVIREGRVISVIRTPMDNGGWVTTFEDVTDQKKAEDRIEYLAHHDALTGLANRVAFRQRLDDALADLEGKRQVALLYLDLDHFKEVNDRLGHPAGDELLRNVAARLRGCLRETGTAARLGGDEFAVIETDLSWVDEAGRLAARIVDAVSAPYQIAGQQIRIGTSIGIAVAPRDGTEAEELVKSADTALYSAKLAGKNTYRYVHDSARPFESADVMANAERVSSLPDRMAPRA